MYYLSKKDRLFILSVVVFLSVLAAAGHFIFKSVLVPVLVVVSSVFLVFFALQLFRRLLVQMEQHRAVVLFSQTTNYDQVEAFLNLMFPLMPDKPLPSFRGWAASPDFLLETVREMERTRPETVLETGSGTSTVIIGLYLKKAGRGKLTSLEHSPEYYEKTRQMLDLHELGDYVDLVHAPIAETGIEGKQWKWYDLEKVDLPDRIDLIVVDGPPEQIQKDARFPAIPLLRNSIHSKTVILVDDGRRDGEKNAVEGWLRFLPGFISEYLPLEKGALRLFFEAGEGLPGLEKADTEQ